MNAVTQASALAPAFCEGIQYFGAPWPGFAEHAAEAGHRPGRQGHQRAPAIRPPPTRPCWRPTPCAT
jgi:hypothetical protein